MGYSIFAFLYLIVLLYFSKVYQKSILNIGNFLVGWYLLSLFCSLFVVYDSISYSLPATIYFLTSLTLFLLPAISFKQILITEIKDLNINLFNVISYIFIVLGISCYVYFSPTIISFFSLGMSIVSLRGEVAGGIAFYNNQNFIYYILTLYCQFYPIVIAFYFYSVAFLNKSRLFNNLLLFASTGYVINVLASLGRSGLVYWPLLFSFNFILFKKFLKPEIQKKTISIIRKVIFLIMILFIIITIGRFSVEEFDKSVLDSLFIYFGDQFGNFNNFFKLFENKGNDVVKFLPILNPGREKILPIDELNYVMSMYGVDGNVFSTFIGDLVKEFDKLYVFIFAFFYAIFGIFFIRANKSVSFGKILILIVLCQIPLTGIFFYDYTHVVSNVYFILILILALLFSKKIVVRKPKNLNIC